MFRFTCRTTEGMVIVMAKIILAPQKGPQESSWQRQLMFAFTEEPPVEEDIRTAFGTFET